MLVRTIDRANLTISLPFDGQTAGEPTSTCIVVPCELAESLSTSWCVQTSLWRGLPSTHFDSHRIRDAFDALDSQLADAPETLFVAICSEDSSIVYYKISKGIIKPQV